MGGMCLYEGMDVGDGAIARKKVRRLMGKIVYGGERDLWSLKGWASEEVEDGEVGKSVYRVPSQRSREERRGNM